jgi:hypothetical protein
MSKNWAGFVFHGPLDQGMRPLRFRDRTVAFRTIDNDAWRVGTVHRDGVWVDAATPMVPLYDVVWFVDLDQVK